MAESVRRKRYQGESPCSQLKAISPVDFFRQTTLQRSISFDQRRASPKHNRNLSHFSLQDMEAGEERTPFQKSFLDERKQQIHRMQSKNASTHITRAFASNGDTKAEFRPLLKRQDDPLRESYSSDNHSFRGRSGYNPLKYRGYLGKPTMSPREGLQDSFQNLNLSSQRDSPSAFSMDQDLSGINQPACTKGRANLTTIHPLTGETVTCLKSTLPLFKGIKTGLLRQADSIKQMGDSPLSDRGEGHWHKRNTETEHSIR